MKKVLKLVIIIVFLLLQIPSAWAHHISMSFSDWKLGPDKATVVFRLPLADAVWIMDPDLVDQSETAITIKKAVDNALKSRVQEFLIKTIPAKVAMTGCEFVPDGFAVSFDKTSVQVMAELSCNPGYMDNLQLTNHFLVDENQLHTSLAFLHFEDRVQQCLFRHSQYTWGGKMEKMPSHVAPEWQARLFPFWDYLALGIIIILLAGSGRAILISLSIVIGAQALAPVCAYMGLQMPSMAILRAVLSVIPVYAGLFLYTRGRTKQGWIWLISGHAVILMMAFGGYIRLTPIMVICLLSIGAGLLGTSINPDKEKTHQETALYLLACVFGLVHGFILLQYRFQYSFSEIIDITVLPAVFFLAGFSFLLFYRQKIHDSRIYVRIAIVLSCIGLFVFLVRNINLPFSTFESENAHTLINNLLQGKEVAASLLPLALILAAIIGGLHALTPGHGKTIVAAYLVGTKGRVSDAFVLGLVVTLTHTFSVIVLALIALFASKYILADQLVPILTGISGFLICILGIYLFQARVRNFRRYGTVTPLPSATGSTHHHEHPHAHEHPHEQHHEHSHKHNHETNTGHKKDVRILTHSHDGVSHSHALPDSSEVSLTSLIALGISGGIVPCPDALAILLLGISMGRIGFGLAVIIAFSVGLAAVLIAIGIAMVKARPLMDRFTGQGRFTSLWLPLISAILVTFLGFIILWKAWPGS